MVMLPCNLKQLDALDSKREYCVQPKVDGVRVTFTEDGLMSRSGKPIPSVALQALAKKCMQSHPGIIGLQAEFMCDPLLTQREFFLRADFKSSHSLAMKKSHPIEAFTNTCFVAFDLINNDTEHLPYVERLDKLKAAVAPISVIMPAPTQLAKLSEITRVYHSANELAHEPECPFEGFILRDPTSMYVDKRATLRSGDFLKLKYVDDSEAEIIGFEQLLHNHNEAYTDTDGKQKRSSHQDNKTESGLVGAFYVIERLTNVTFKLSAGALSHEERKHVWDNRHQYLGKQLKYKFTGRTPDNIPRFAVIQGFRSIDDMGEES